MSLALQCEGQSRDFAEPRSPEFVTNMGGTNSHPGVNSNQTQLKTYKGFECYNDRQVISKESFRNKFNPCFYELAGLLWDYFSYDNHNSDNCLSIKEYENIIDCLSSSQEKLTIFINLFKRHTLSELDIRALFKWFTLGRNLQSGTWQLILNSILPSNKDGLYKCDEVISCLNRKCQDVCNDLVTILLQCLNDNQSFDLVDFNPYTHFGTILTPDLLWLLSTCLTYPYKRAPKTCLLLTKPLECEQLSHLHCLYNSTSHGMSLTRLLELTFDYNGPVIVLLKAKEFLFCLLSDQGLKESLKPFGGDNSFLYQIEPTFSRLVSGKLGSDSGIVYANFTTKTSKRGLLVGHQPLLSPVIEISEDFNELIFNSGLPLRLSSVEVWAAGSDDHILKLKDQKAWESKEVTKAKERKLKNESWQDSGDRYLLELDGRKVHHSDMVEPS